MDRTVATGDDPPAVLARMPADFVDSVGPRLKPGKLLRFVVEEPGIQVGPSRRRLRAAEGLPSRSKPQPRPRCWIASVRGVGGVRDERSLRCTTSNIDDNVNRRWSD